MRMYKKNKTVFVIWSPNLNFWFLTCGLSKIGVLAFWIQENVGRNFHFCFFGFVYQLILNKFDMVHLLSTLYQYSTGTDLLFFSMILSIFLMINLQRLMYAINIGTIKYQNTCWKLRKRICRDNDFLHLQFLFHPVFTIYQQGRSMIRLHCE